MNLLAIDTATECCSVALTAQQDGARRCYWRSEIRPTGHFGRVLAMVEACLAEAGKSLGEVDLVAADVGPGSFTGLRIGIGMAQGLAYGSGAKTVGICSLEALAWDALRQCPAANGVVPAIDARMRQVYWAGYRRADDHPGGLTPLCAPAVDYPQAVRPAPAPGEWVGCGSGWDAYPAQLAGAAGRGVSRLDNRFPQATAVAELAAARVDTATSPLLLCARYVRNQVAEQPDHLRDRRVSTAAGTDGA